ncbi:MAG: hypothetical protein ABJO01_10085 [Parasphingorhabdus sp.]|uniref:hypothetical protein n=1 Tax=Parasphingorhabdus sp. TaxID=2709688 RepID=UPI003296B821
MPSYLDTDGAPVSAHTATIDGKLRAGFKQMLDEGDSLSFDVALIDSTPIKTSDSNVYLLDKISETSIEDAFRTHLEVLGKPKQLNAIAQLLTMDARQVDELVRQTAVKILTAQVGAASVSKVINDGHFDGLFNRVNEIFDKHFETKIGLSRTLKNSAPNF